MISNRRVILNLIAMGRITPAEAERLLAAWNEGRETLWILTVCMVCACLAEWPVFAPALLRATNALLPLMVAALHHARSLIANHLGGIV